MPALGIRTVTMSVLQLKLSGLTFRFQLAAATAAAAAKAAEEIAARQQAAQAEAGLEYKKIKNFSNVKTRKTRKTYKKRIRTNCLTHTSFYSPSKTRFFTLFA